MDILISHNNIHHLYVSIDKKVLSLGCEPAVLLPPFIEKSWKLSVVDEYVGDELANCSRHVC